MDKYVCGPCGYVYDPADGDPDNGIDPVEQVLRIFPMIGAAPSVVPQKKILIKNK